MRLDAAIVAIERRSIAECIDLAFLFCRAHLGPIGGLTLVFAVPACAWTWWIAGAVDGGLALGGLVFFALSPILGASLVAGAGPCVFGERFGIARALGRVLRRAVPMLFYTVFSRCVIVAGFFVAFVPALTASVWMAAFPEVALLEGLRGGRAFRRLLDLLSGDFVRAHAAMSAAHGFQAVLVLVGFVLVDLTLDIVFGVPVLFGRIAAATAGEMAEEIAGLLFNDPLVVVVQLALLWVTYPIVRLTWFFYYLDSRIRREGWDIELDFRIEARRLEALR